MRRSILTSIVMISLLVASGCGSLTVAGQGQPPPPSISTLFGQKLTFVADRAMNSAASSTQPSSPTEALSEGDYAPLPQDKSYPVSFTVDGETVTVGGATPMTGTWDQLAGSTRRFTLSDGTFAGGRFDVWSDNVAIAAELTIYGSGVPIVSSERGTVVE